MSERFIKAVMLFGIKRFIVLIGQLVLVFLQIGTMLLTVCSS